MNLAFFGTSEFAVPTLHRLAPFVRLVVTQPDRPTGRKLQLRESPVKGAARALGLPVVSPERCRSRDFVEFMAGARETPLELWSPVGGFDDTRAPFDALVVAAYGQILPEALLEPAARGGINLHGSILPRFRGAAPIQRAIMSGESRTGVTLMQMDRGMDTGDIIAATVTDIGAEETFGELQGRLAEMAAELAFVWMPRICSGIYPRTQQDESESSYANKIERADRMIQIKGRAHTEAARIRALTPTPGALLPLSNGALRIWKARSLSESGESGTVLEIRPELVIAFARGSLQILEMQAPGKNRISGAHWANGMRLHKGDRLEFAEVVS